LKILFTGDFCPAEIDFDGLRIDPGLLRLMNSADLVVGNLECPFTERPDSRKGQFVNLQARPEMNSLLARFSAFSLANNHILDFGPEGAGDTIDFLSFNGIDSFGYAATPKEAAAPVRLEEEGRTIALFGTTQWYCGRKGREGTCSDRNRSLFRNIRQCSRNGDLVIVMPHWNYEFADFPAPAVRRLARKLINCGADLVIGTHPHVINGIESYKGKTIAYSLGNFLFTPRLVFSQDENDPRVSESFILECTLTTESMDHEVRINPVRFYSDSIQLLSGGERQQFLERVDWLSSVFSRNRKAKRAFYSQSRQILRNVSGNMKSIQDRQGPQAILGRLHRARMQDLLLAISAFTGKDRQDEKVENPFQ